MWGITKDQTHSSLRNKSIEIRKAFSDAANKALSEGRDEDSCVFSGLAVVANLERKKAKEIQESIQQDKLEKSNAVIPEHLRVLQEAAELKKQAKLQEELRTNEEFRSKVMDVVKDFGNETDITSLYFDTEGKLIIVLSDGNKIKSSNTVPADVINQYISVQAQSQGSGELPEEYEHIQFNLDSTSESQVGRLVWNAADGTLDLGMSQGGVVQQIGMETYFHIKNTSGQLLTDGTVVMATGAVGNSGRITVGLAEASPSIPSIYTIGICTHDIAAGNDGFVTNFGLIRGIDTRGTSVGETWVDGDVLYVHPTQPGKLSKVAPTAPIPKIIVAMVIRAHQNGSVFVRPTYSYKLGELNDVLINSPQQGQVLKYDSATGVWKNQPDNTSGDAPEINPNFTYNVSGDIIRIDYQSGNYKIFSYNLDGDLSQLDYIIGAVTYRKTYNYTLGVLTSITDSVV